MGVAKVENNWASEASPTLGCSIEISRDIMYFSERSEADSQTRKFLNFTLRIIQNKYSLENRKSLEMPPGVRTSHHSNAHEQ